MHSDISLTVAIFELMYISNWYDAKTEKSGLHVLWTSIILVPLLVY